MKSSNQSRIIRAEFIKPLKEKWIICIMLQREDIPNMVICGRDAPPTCHSRWAANQKKLKVGRAKTAHFRYWSRTEAQCQMNTDYYKL